MLLIFFGPNLVWALPSGRVYPGLLLLPKLFINEFLGMGKMWPSDMISGLEIVHLKLYSGIFLKSVNNKMPQLPKFGMEIVYT